MSRPVLSGATGGTGLSGRWVCCSVIQASRTPYGTTLTSGAALTKPSCPSGSAPGAPASCCDSGAWSTPVTVTSPAGAAGTRSGSAVPGSQPRTTGSALPPPSGRSRDST